MKSLPLTPLPLLAEGSGRSSLDSTPPERTTTMTRLRGSNHSALRYVTRCVLLLQLAAPPVCVRSRPRALIASFALGEEGGGGGVRRQWPRRRQLPSSHSWTLVLQRPRGSPGEHSHAPPIDPRRSHRGGATAQCERRNKRASMQHARRLPHPDGAQAYICSGSRSSTPSCPRPHSRPRLYSRPRPHSRPQGPYFYLVSSAITNLYGILCSSHMQHKSCL